MISKIDVLKNFNKDEHDDVIKIYEMMQLSYLKGIPVFSKIFCTPNIWMYFTKTFSTKTFKVEAKGYFEESDRRVISFNNIYDSEYPYQIIKIKNNSKFSKLQHKDYLGSIMSLGVNREKFGDLRVSDDYAIMPVYEDIAEYIITNLNSVGKSPVNCEFVYDNEYIESDFIEEIITVSSLRLDSFVAKLAKTSRSKALDFINENKVLVDYCKTNDKSLELNVDERITIKGIGKYVIGNIIGNTKSGKYKINIKKYK